MVNCKLNCIYNSNNICSKQSIVILGIGCETQIIPGTESKSKYQKAQAKEEEMHRETLAQLADEFTQGDPYCTDSRGNWMTKEELVEAIRTGKDKWGTPIE